ncbi:MAG: lipoyl synthase [Flavobacteriales bacterium]|nr:lipoyl synthase [Flavobacteriales bacterium]
MSDASSIDKLKKPDWLKVRLPSGPEFTELQRIVSDNKLHTICDSGNCPNKGECWGEGTATFMILGNVCTRSCGFCAVSTGRPDAVDVFEPLKVAKAVKLMNVKHCVVTSVDRDDLSDGGAEIWVKTIAAIRRLNAETTMETLIPDFQGIWENLELVIDAKPEIISHNLETVKRLTKEVRIQAKYERSLEVIKRVSAAGIRSKSGLMLGLGESEKEVFEAMDDLLESKCDVLTLGQYLQPTKKHLPVTEFIHPDKFLMFKEEGLKKGFKYVESAPLVRSSYHAERHLG